MKAFTPASAAEIVRHYRAKGLGHGELTDALRKHARLLYTLDPEVAADIEDARPSMLNAWLREKKWEEANRVATREWLRRRRQDPEFRAKEAVRNRAYRASRKARAASK